MLIGIYEKNGKLLKTANLNKKIKKLKNINVIYQTEFNGSLYDVDKFLDNILNNILNSNEFNTKDLNQENLNTKLYQFKNKKDNSVISSIYDNLNNLNDIINVNDYERIK